MIATISRAFADIQHDLGVDRAVDDPVHRPSQGVARAGLHPEAPQQRTQGPALAARRRSRPVEHVSKLRLHGWKAAITAWPSSVTSANPPWRPPVRVVTNGRAERLFMRLHRVPGAFVAEADRLGCATDRAMGADRLQ